MTVFVPNTTVRVERVNATEPATGAVEGYPGDGDAPENWTPTVSGAPAYLYEDEQRTWDPTTGRMSVRDVTRMRARPDLALRDRDRVVDELSGLVYQVDTVTTPSTVIGMADVLATLVRVT